MVRITSKPESEAAIHDCVAHRCEKHASIDAVMLIHTDGPPDNVAECSYCVADDIVKTLVAETIFPVVAAFEAAEGALRLLGVDRHPKAGALFKLLAALTEKAGENDFQVTAQKVIAGVVQAQGPERPQ